MIHYLCLVQYIQMRDHLSRVLVIVILLFNVSLTKAQNVVGTVVDQANIPLIGASVSIIEIDELEYTNATGKFRFFDVPDGSYTMKVEYDGESIGEHTFDLTGSIDLGFIQSQRSTTDESVSEKFAIVTLNASELEGEQDESAVSSLLSASRDAFVRTSAFGFGAARFRGRGLDSEYESIYINGVPMNELENGRIYFGQWGGLNDMFRTVHNNYGLTHSEYGIGGMMGNTNIDIRAGSQRPQTRVSYALANRSYSNRVMLTHSTGMNEKGWALSFSGSRRWAEEGHVTGTFYDAWGYFFGAEKMINKSNSLYFNLFGNHSRRGKSGASLQEIIDLTGDRFYNPHWGWQNGEKRNSRIGHNHQPVFMLGHDFNKGKLNVNTAVSYQFGPNGGTALNWDGAPNPAGDYHQKLLTREDNTLILDELEQLMIDNPDYFQVNWDYIYQANLNETQVFDADGIEGNTRTGKRARYWVEDRRYDSKEFNAVTNLTYELNGNNTLTGGLRYQNYVGHTFTEVEDLLGADFVFDIDRFADGISNPGTEQKDLNNPNSLKKEGDIFGYDYNAHINKTGLWIQDEIKTAKFDFFLGGEFNMNSFYRVGNMRNGFYPDNSFGQSETYSFDTYRLKGGLTYKINGRNYAWVNGFMGTEAPTFRDAYMNARISDFINPLIEESSQRSVEIGFVHRSPKFTFKGVSYLADIENESEIVFFYSEDFVEDFQSNGVFGSFANSNIDKRHVGLELAVEYSFNSRWSAQIVSALGQHLYDSRWQQYALADDLGFFREDITVYTNGFYVESSPQTAHNITLEYNSPNYWFATLSFNYFDNRYLDFSPDKRIESTTQNIEADVLQDIVIQEKLASAYTLDLFAYKSFKIDDYFLYITLSANNLLNNKDFITGGYEQLRFDPERGPDYFAPRYYYAYGRNYFLGLAFRL